MMQNFQQSKFNKSEQNIFRLGLSATYWPGKRAIYKAIDEGLNFFFMFGIDKQMFAVLKDVMKGKRDQFIIVTGAYNLLYGHPNLRRTLEKRLRQLNTDYIDMFLFLGVTQPKHFSEHVKEEFFKFREEGKVGGAGLSTHHRKFAGELASSGDVDVLMVRYNAAHRGAEQDISPYLTQHKPFVIGYTATRWTYLLRRHKNLPKDSQLPTAGQCYRFVLSNPNIDVCLTAPRKLRELEENLSAVRQGPLSIEEMAFIKEYGDSVYNLKKWFM